MYCQKIHLSNYRNIRKAEIEFSEGVNVLYGDNAQGKTNFLESIYYFACGKSFRGAKDKEIILFGEDRSYIKLLFEDKDRKRDHEVRLSRSERRLCFKEGIKISRMSEFIGTFRAVLFSPEHLSIVKDGPAERRNFEDVAISQLYPVYMSSLSKYQKLIMERNSVLKDSESPDFRDMIQVLSVQIAKEAEIIGRYRDAYTKRLSDHVQAIISDMTCGKENVSIEYTGYRDEEALKRQLTENLDKEIRAGSTLYGTHKDDLLIKLNGNDSRVFASQGQQRSISLAMKLAEGEISKEITGEYPVFLFDDILSELDRKRKDYVISGLNGMQVIITCCEEIPNGRIFTVKNGMIEN